MKKTLVDDIIEELNNHRNALPFNVSILDDLLIQLQTGSEASAYDEEGSIWIQHILESHSSVMTETGNKLVNQCQIYLIPHDYYNATAITRDNERSIIIYRGLLELVFYHAIVSLLTEKYSKALDGHFKQRGNALPPSGTIVVMLQLLAVRFINSAEHLPDIYRLLDEGEKELVLSALEHAVIFLVFHEIGHFELDHLSLNPLQSRTSIDELVIKEELSEFQRQEIDADEFALSLFNPEFQGVIPSMAHAALFPLGYFEPLLDIKGNSHPFSVNRLANIDYICSEKAKSLDIDGSLENYHKLSESALRMRKGVDWLYNIASRNDIFSTLNQLSDHLLSFGVDLRCALENTLTIEQYWLTKPSSGRAKGARR